MLSLSQANVVKCHDLQGCTLVAPFFITSIVDLQYTLASWIFCYIVHDTTVV